MLTKIDQGQELRSEAKSRLRHFLADFVRLEQEYPGVYPNVIVRGEGPYLFDDKGRKLLDAGNHLGACNIGHGRKDVARRMAEQAERLEFSALDSGNSHDVAIRYARRLAEILPMDDPCISFCNSGSEGNELAIKIARSYFTSKDEPKRTKVLSRHGSYHGSSYGAMAATGIEAFSAGFGQVPAGFSRIPQPSHDRCAYCGNSETCTLACIEATEQRIVAEGADTIAAIIGEPVAIAQAVKVPHPEYWPRIADLCRRTGALLIADEVVTGFGRTGRMFGCEHWGIRPDIMVMAKGITSGYVPMGAVAVTARVNQAFRDRPLLHLNTFAGHPVACAAAEATLDILERERLVENAARLEPVLRRELERVASAIPQVGRVSVTGLMSSLEADASKVGDIPAFVRSVRYHAYQNNLLIRANSDDKRISVFFYPPLDVTQDDVVTGVGALEAALSAAFASP
jgi:adenosylmethionine-8-amino-7-oxononanoate aminotransferase